MAEDPNYDVDIVSILSPLSALSLLALQRLCFAAPAEPPHPTKKAKLSPPSTGTKRLFPGPAGLLSGALCSQNTSLPFEEPPWKEMTRYSGSLCDHFNIAWIKGQAKCNQFRIQKVPFLAGVVLCLEVDGGDGQKSVNVTLKDPTGNAANLPKSNSLKQQAFRHHSRKHCSERVRGAQAAFHRGRCSGSGGVCGTFMQLPSVRQPPPHHHQQKSQCHLWQD